MIKSGGQIEHTKMLEVSLLAKLCMFGLALNPYRRQRSKHELLQVLGLRVPGMVRKDRRRGRKQRESLLIDYRYHRILIALNSTINGWLVSLSDPIRKLHCSSGVRSKVLRLLRYIARRVNSEGDQALLWMKAVFMKFRHVSIESCFPARFTRNEKKLLPPFELIRRFKRPFRKILLIMSYAKRALPLASPSQVEAEMEAAMIRLQNPFISRAPMRKIIRSVTSWAKFVKARGAKVSWDFTVSKHAAATLHHSRRAGYRPPLDAYNPLFVKGGRFTQPPLEPKDKNEPALHYQRRQKDSQDKREGLCRPPKYFEQPKGYSFGHQVPLPMDATLKSSLELLKRKWVKGCLERRNVMTIINSMSELWKQGYIPVVKCQGISEYGLKSRMVTKSSSYFNVGWTVIRKALYKLLGKDVRLRASIFGNIQESVESMGTGSENAQVFSADLSTATDLEDQLFPKQALLCLARVFHFPEAIINAGLFGLSSFELVDDSSYHLNYKKKLPSAVLSDKAYNRTVRGTLMGTPLSFFFLNLAHVVAINNMIASRKLLPRAWTWKHVQNAFRACGDDLIACWHPKIIRNYKIEMNKLGFVFNDKSYLSKDSGIFCEIPFHVKRTPIKPSAHAPRIGWRKKSSRLKVVYPGKKRKFLSWDYTNDDSKDDEKALEIETRSLNKRTPKARSSDWSRDHVIKPPKRGYLLKRLVGKPIPKYRFLIKPETMHVTGSLVTDSLVKLAWSKQSRIIIQMRKTGLHESLPSFLGGLDFPGPPKVSKKVWGKLGTIVYGQQAPFPQGSGDPEVAAQLGLSGVLPYHTHNSASGCKCRPKKIFQYYRWTKHPKKKGWLQRPLARRRWWLGKVITQPCGRSDEYTSSRPTAFFYSSFHDKGFLHRKPPSPWNEMLKLPDKFKYKAVITRVLEKSGVGGSRDDIQIREPIHILRQYLKNLPNSRLKKPSSSTNWVNHWEEIRDSLYLLPVVYHFTGKEILSFNDIRVTAKPLFDDLERSKKFEKRMLRKGRLIRLKLPTEEMKQNEKKRKRKQHRKNRNCLNDKQ